MNKRVLKYFGHLILFWMIFFSVDRLLFLIYNLDTSGLSFFQLIEPFWRSLRLDLSAACYLIIPPFLLWLIGLLIPLRSVGVLLKVYFYIFVPILVLGVVASMEIYSEWGYKLNRDAIDYLKYPREFWASSLNSPLGLLLIIYSICTILFTKWGFHIAGKFQDFSNIASGLNGKKLINNVGIAITGFIVFSVCIRGGIQLAPINQSFSYYSNNPTLNATAVNTFWNLIYSYSRENHKNSYQFFTADEIESKFNKSKETYINTPKIFSMQKPNIIMIVLEGVAAELFESMGGRNKYTSNMDRLIKNGLLFDQIFATETRTDRGIVSILSGYPSLPLISLVKQPDKAAKLSFLPKHFLNNEYETVFFYGGESEFANIKSYLLNAGFNQIIDKNDFDKKDMNSKWGAHDHIMFKKSLSELKKLTEPFFATILTLSSHEPFEVPIDPILKGEDRQTLYKNSIIYTDESVGRFMSSIKEESYFQNTIFIFISDHGFRMGDGHNRYPRRYHIPLFIYGDPLGKKWRGRKISIIGSQTDLAKTILNQFDLKYNGFLFSKDLLNNVYGNAFYTFNNGFGLIEEEQSVIYDHDSKSVTYLNNFVSDSVNQFLFDKGRAKLQKTYQDFIDR